MQSILDIDGEAEDFCALLGGLTPKPNLLAPDIQKLRHAFYRDGVVDRRRAAAIFQANRLMRARHDAWAEFYLEVLTDFFLAFRGNVIVLSVDSETTLLAWLGEGPSIDNVGERRLTTRIFLKAADVSERFERRLLDAIRDNLLHCSERWHGSGTRSACMIDAMDLQLIRRLVGRDDPFHPRAISRVGVEFLLDLDQNAEHVADPKSWRQLLIDSLAGYLSDDSGAASIMGDGVEPKLTRLLDGCYASDEVSRLRSDILSAAVQIEVRAGGKERKRAVSRSVLAP